MNVHDRTLADYRDIGNDHEPKTNMRRKKIRGSFVQKVPLENWLKYAFHLPGKALHVAVLLQHVDGLAKGKEFTVTTKMLRDFGIDRKTFRRALNLLEKEKLIKVDVRRGKKPRIKILEKEEHHNDNT